MTILTVRHVTTYRYRRPVALGEHRMMFRPRDSYDQRLIELAAADHAGAGAHPLDPRPVRQLRRAGAVQVAHVGAAVREHDFRVDHYPDNVPDFQTEPRAKTYPFVYGSEEMPDLMASIARGYPDPNGEIDHWVSKFLLPGRPTPTESS